MEFLAGLFVDVLDFFSELVLIISSATKDVRRHFDAFRC